MNTRRQRRGDRRVQMLHVGQFSQRRRFGKRQGESERRQPSHDGIEHMPLLAQVLLARQQLRPERGVFAGTPASTRRTGQRLGLQHALAHAHQPLRTRADEALPASVRDRETVALRKTLAQSVEQPQRMQRRIRLHVLHTREHDFFHRSRRDGRESAFDRLPEITRFGGRKHRRLCRARFVGIRDVFELPVRPQHALGERRQFGIRRHQQIRHRRRHVPCPRHLPAGHKHPRRRKRFPGLDRLEKRKRAEKMRPSKRRVDIAHRNRPRQHVVDEALHGCKPLRSRGLVHEQRLGSGDGRLDIRPLRVEVKFARFKNRLEHRERIQRADFDRDAHQPLASIGPRRVAALAQKRDQRLGRGVFGGIERKDGHARVRGGEQRAVTSSRPCRLQDAGRGSPSRRPSNR